MPDVFGRMLYDYHRDRLAGAPQHRREDGVAWDVTGLLEHYFASPDAWSDAEFGAVSHLDGPILDLGCGPGRHALYLQDRAEVVALDRSPLAVRTARERGVERAVVGEMEQLPVGRSFESVLAAGGQLGVPGSIEGLRDLLVELARVVRPGSTLVADILDPSGIEDPDRQAYLETNQVREGVSLRRFRVEYDGEVGPWIDLLMMTADAFREVVGGSAWHLEEVLDRGASVTAILEREAP